MSEAPFTAAWIEWTDAPATRPYRISRSPAHELPLATLNLIERIYREFPTDARRILRNRIFTNESESSALAELIKVGAKRRGFSATIPEWEDFTQPAAAIPEPPEEYDFDSKYPFSWPEDRRQSVPSSSPIPRYARDREVRATLLIPGRSPSQIFRNQNHQIKTWHAEMLLLRAFDYKIPAGSILRTTLKPCRMCAAWILACRPTTPGSSFTVRYRDDDPGRWARGTALDPHPEIQGQEP